ncbi:dolichol phosphate-mannose biosynthesis regulatory protein [Anaeramoeba flamelloides]|uniref:Dolichol phosphate-mannose biosynthesis regulatory protein n=1 Tax=Anaeramoeba flamelloides TaxID=1746091 RepID=A0AAV7ZMK7_9EUKA|nr:dolichol phosphate-mannose biosynthesis regulatory protein [Anaeramoeba flamelloides]
MIFLPFVEKSMWVKRIFPDPTYGLAIPILSLAFLGIFLMTSMGFIMFKGNAWKPKRSIYHQAFPKDDLLWWIQENIEVAEAMKKKEEEKD